MNNLNPLLAKQSYKEKLDEFPQNNCCPNSNALFFVVYSMINRNLLKKCRVLKNFLKMMACSFHFIVIVVNILKNYKHGVKC